MLGPNSPCASGFPLGHLPKIKWRRRKISIGLVLIGVILVTSERSVVWPRGKMTAARSNKGKPHPEARRCVAEGQPLVYTSLSGLASPL